jgi:hypothetical protein
VTTLAPTFSNAMDVECDENLVLDDEDGMVGKTAALHEASPAPLSAIAGDCRLLESGDLSRAVDPSSKLAASVMIDA